MVLHMVEVYAENAVGFSDIVDTTVTTRFGSGGGASSFSSSRKEEAKTESTAEGMTAGETETEDPAEDTWYAAGRAWAMEKGISAYAVQAMNEGAGRGSVKGNDDSTLNPGGNAQRTHAAQMLMKYLNN